ncbi:hypothetical protein SAMN04488542_11598 [Fontibacillus panacisegetis]|uniref:DUF5597 domain-containing protein n=2 Tax=Fontibacillus panacisegetis TaxID=670482 RepID=A0A1G7NBZ2_9BACL|nr:hypothetical protein SAMN04488542_11598 [Fontibacillus panacisegetis]
MDISGGGIVIEVSEDEFIFAGLNFDVQFTPLSDSHYAAEFIAIEEGEFDQESWVRSRRLKRDELVVRFNPIYSIKKVKVFAY